MNIQSPITRLSHFPTGFKGRVIGFSVAFFLASLVLTFSATPVSAQLEIVQTRQANTAPPVSSRNQQTSRGDQGRVDLGTAGNRRVDDGSDAAKVSEREMELIKRLERQIEEQRNSQGDAALEEQRLRAADARARRNEELFEQGMISRSAATQAGAFAPGRASAKGSVKFSLPKAPILLKIEPALLIVKPGGQYSSKVMMANFSDQELDEVHFVLRFDPRLLQVKETEVVSEEDEAVADVQVQWDNQLGRLEFLEQYTAPQNMSDWLLTIHWLPVGEAVGSARIDFERQMASTSLSLAGQELTTFGPNAANWLLSSAVRLMGEQGQSKPMVIDDRSRNATAAIAQGGQYNGQLAAAPQVYLSTPQSALPAKGNIWTIDVVLNNPGGGSISDIDLELSYDPQKLALIDYDRDNFIRRGVNLWDGFARDNFPFDRHLANRQDRAGHLIYHMGFWQPRNCASGPFARLHLMVLQPVAPGDFLQIVQCKIK